MWDLTLRRILCRGNAPRHAIKLPLIALREPAF